MHRQAKKERTPRNVWADDVKDRLADVEKRREELDREEEKIKLSCNHTFQNGTSALESKEDFDDWTMQVEVFTCTACKLRTR